MSEFSFYLTPGERDDYGVIVSAAELTTGERWTFEVKGSVTAALQVACDRIDARPGEWRILALCTPVTIRRDLEGGRYPLAKTGGNAKGQSDYYSQVPVLPETLLLKLVDRMDLLHPRYPAGGKRRRRRWRR